MFFILPFCVPPPTLPFSVLQAIIINHHTLTQSACWKQSIFSKKTHHTRTKIIQILDQKQQSRRNFSNKRNRTSQRPTNHFDVQKEQNRARRTTSPRDYEPRKDHENFKPSAFAGLLQGHKKKVKQNNLFLSPSQFYFDKKKNTFEQKKKGYKTIHLFSAIPIHNILIRSTPFPFFQ